MNATLDLLRTRRSVPPAQLREPGPDAGELEAILAAAMRVPDHGKLAPWRFLVIAGEARHRIGRAIADTHRADNPQADEKRLSMEAGRLAHAPLVVAVVSCARPHVKIPEWEQVLSAGAATTNLMIAANALGYATSWLTEWFAYDRRVLDALGLEPDERIAGFVHVGTPAEIPPDRVRPDPADVVSHVTA